VAPEQPELLAPRPGAAGLCAVCRGPSGRGIRCFLCDLHLQCAPGSLADLVVPVAYAVKGGAHATHLWQYKSDRAGPRAADRAGRRLAALLLGFLRDHGGCAGRAAGIGAPTHLAVVPSARGRPGVHPLRALIAPQLPGPAGLAPAVPARWAELTARPDGQRIRDLDPGRFFAGPVPGARVLLLDDTWVTGSSAQSAAMALRRAGALAVVTVVLGRHVGPGDLGAAAMPFRRGTCVVHEAVGLAGDQR